jgi:hypothetical protein
MKTNITQKLSIGFHQFSNAVNQLCNALSVKNVTNFTNWRKTIDIHSQAY